MLQKLNNLSYQVLPCLLYSFISHLSTRPFSGITVSCSKKTPITNKGKKNLFHNGKIVLAVEVPTLINKYEFKSNYNNLKLTTRKYELLYITTFCRLLLCIVQSLLEKLRMQSGNLPNPSTITMKKILNNK